MCVGCGWDGAGGGGGGWKRGGVEVGSSVAKVSCILRHLGVQLIFAYSWIRPAILVEQRRIVFISSVSSLSFLFLFLPCLSRPSPLLSLLSLFSFSLRDDAN